MTNPFSQATCFSRQRAGYTIIEVIITIALFTMIVYATLALVSNLFTMSSKQSSVLGSVDQARKVAFGLTNELRKAAPSDTGAYSLGETGSQQLIFYSNIDSDSLIERIRYFVQGVSLKRGVLKPTGTPLSYNPANESVSTAQANLANGANPVFYYYDGSYNGTADNFLAQPVNITQVRYVKISLEIVNTAGQAGTGTFTVAAGATIRNLKTNIAD